MPPRTILHLLSIRQDLAQTRKVRATIRTGIVLADQELFFSSADGSWHKVTILERRDGHHSMALTLAFDNMESAAALRKGTYLYTFDRSPALG